MTMEPEENVLRVTAMCGKKTSQWAVREIERLRKENVMLHVALFHVENGLSHPDEAVRKLIEAAFKAGNQDAK